MIQGHGDDIYLYPQKIKFNFSSNIFGGINHIDLWNHLSGREEIIKRYPEPLPLTLEKLISQKEGISQADVMVTNGVTEAIYLIARWLERKKCGILIPTFREYQDACKGHHVEINFLKSLEEITPELSAVWLCNPNNPTGVVVESLYLKNIIESNPDIIFIIDQAYEDYSVKPVIESGYIKKNKNVIILKSLTKRFCIPGLRIGYAIGDSHSLHQIKNLRMPWSVNAIAIESAAYLLENSHKYIIDKDFLHHQILAIGKSLKKLGIEMSQTDCNFALFRLPVAKSADLKKFLIQSYGILIRDASNFEGLDSHHFRIAAQDVTSNNFLIKGIEAWMKF